MKRQSLRKPRMGLKYAADMFRHGLNTQEIAEAMGREEHEVYNHLAYLRASGRFKA